MMPGLKSKLKTKLLCYVHLSELTGDSVEPHWMTMRDSSRHCRAPHIEA
jgi:hypothetical protein